MFRTERLFREIVPRQDRSIGRGTQFEAGMTGFELKDEGPPWKGRSGKLVVPLLDLQDRNCGVDEQQRKTGVDRFADLNISKVFA